MAARISVAGNSKELSPGHNAWCRWTLPDECNSAQSQCLMPTTRNRSPRRRLSGKDRISQSGVNWVKWTGLLLQAACTLVAVAMVHSDNGRATAIALGIFAPLTAGHSDSRRESAE